MFWALMSESSRLASYIGRAVGPRYLHPPAIGNLRWDMLIFQLLSGNRFDADLIEDLTVIEMYVRLVGRMLAILGVTRRKASFLPPCRKT